MKKIIISILLVCTFYTSVVLGKILPTIGSALDLQYGDHVYFTYHIYVKDKIDRLGSEYDWCYTDNFDIPLNAWLAANDGQQSYKISGIGYVEKPKESDHTGESLYSFEVIITIYDIKEAWERQNKKNQTSNSQSSTNSSNTNETKKKKGDKERQYQENKKSEANQSTTTTTVESTYGSVVGGALDANTSSIGSTTVCSTVGSIGDTTGGAIASTYGSGNVYDISNISKVKLVTEYDNNTLVDNMDTVIFGSYYQSNVSSKEPIEWLVLDRQGNRVLLLSKYILDYKCYNDTLQDITWENCTLRYWLNSTFLNTAFNSSEQAYIETLNLINSNNAEYGTIGGNNTNDKLFCISTEEIIKYFNLIISNTDMLIRSKKVATRGTNYADSVKPHDLNYLEINDWAYGNNNFWIRGPGQKQYCAMYVWESGIFTDFGGMVMDPDTGVRPALWLNTSSFVNSQNNVVNYTQVSSNTINKNTIIEESVSAPAPNSWYKNESGLWYYYESDGITPKKGWFIDNSDNQTYYFDPITGVMAVGWTKIGDKYYYFNESNNDVENLHETGDDVRNSNNGKVKGYGSMFRNETTPDGNFVNENGEWVDKLESTKINSLNKYLVVFAALIIIIALICIIAIKFFANKDFKISINELMSNNKNMIAIIIVIVIVLIVIIIIMKNTIFVTKNVIKSDSGGKYYLDTNGNRVINDWFKYEDYYYYTDGNGYIETNKWVDKEYFVDKDGKMLINTWYVDNDNNKYYLGNDGKYYRNELYTIDGKEYYFDDSGKVITNITFVVPSNSYVSYFDNDGAMVKANDFVKVGDKELFINDKGRIVGNDWVSKDGNWYYLGANGEVLKNQWIDNTYYVDANGIMLKNTKTPDGSEVGSDGRILEKYNNNSVNDITGVIKNAKAVTPHTYNSDTSSNTIANSNKKYKNGVRVVVEGDWVNHNKKSKTIAGISQTDDITGCVGMLQGGKKDMMCLIGHKVGDIVEESGIDVFGKSWTAWYEILAIYDERPW